MVWRLRRRDLRCSARGPRSSGSWHHGGEFDAALALSLQLFERAFVLSDREVASAGPASAAAMPRPSPRLAPTTMMRWLSIALHMRDLIGAVYAWFTPP
ncbi:MAG TPA: hypothetical protein VGJ66_20615 [Pyrinomonadaceae bacterium]